MCNCEGCVIMQLIIEGVFHKEIQGNLEGESSSLSEVT